jgi:hypothetical protein
VLPGENVAQLGTRVLGRVADIHAAGADERATVFEDDPPAAEVPLSYPRAAWWRKPSESSTERWVSQRTLPGCNTIPFRATVGSDGALVGLSVVA